MPPAAPLTGTVALVTGASSGIGEATAKQLAELGAHVALAARREDRLEKLTQEITGDGGRALPLPADVTNRDEAETAVRRTVEEFGRLDILINNAGVMLLGPILDAPVDEWERMVELNVLGLLYCTKAAIPHLLEAAEQEPRRVADLVNISSVAGRQARLGSGVYNATKHAVGAFSESLRQEVTRRHVRVDRAGGRRHRACRPQPPGGPRDDGQTVRRHGAAPGCRHRGRDLLRRHSPAPRRGQRGAHPADRAGAVTRVGLWQRPRIGLPRQRLRAPAAGIRDARYGGHRCASKVAPRSILSLPTCLTDL